MAHEQNDKVMVATKCPCWVLSWWVWWCLEALTASHQQAVDDQGHTTAARGPHSEAVVNLKRSVMDAQAEDRGPL